MKPPLSPPPRSLTANFHMHKFGYVPSKKRLISQNVYTEPNIICPEQESQREATLLVAKHCLNILSIEKHKSYFTNCCDIGQ